MTQRRDELKTFSLANRAGPGRGDVATLLRSLASSVAALGDIQIMDIVFHSEVTDAEDDIHFTVYYYDEPRRR